MYFRYFVITSPRKKVWLFIWTNLNSLYLGIFCAKFGWNWSSAYGEDFYKIVNVCSPFCSCLPLEKGVAFHFNRLECPSPKDDLRQVWLKLVQWFWRRRFLNIVNEFCYFFFIISPWKKGLPFNWTKLNPLHPRKLCAKFGWN